MNKSWETGARYGYVTGSPDDDLILRRPTIGIGSAQVTHYPSHFSRLRLQEIDNPLYRDEPIYVGMLMTLGAHGAHVLGGGDVETTEPHLAQRS